MGAALGKLSQPDFLPISRNMQQSESLNRYNNAPVVQLLQSVHDQISFSMVVMGGQVVNSASKNLTLSKEWIKPVGVSSSWSWTNQDLKKVTNIF